MVYVKIPSKIESSSKRQRKLIGYHLNIAKHNSVRLRARLPPERSVIIFWKMCAAEARHRGLSLRTTKMTLSRRHYSTLSEAPVAGGSVRFAQQIQSSVPC